MQASCSVVQAQISMLSTTKDRTNGAVFLKALKEDHFVQVTIQTILMRIEIIEKIFGTKKLKPPRLISSNYELGSGASSTSLCKLLSPYGPQP